MSALLLFLFTEFSFLKEFDVNSGIFFIYI